MKQIIRLTESDIHNMVNEALDEILGFGRDQNNEYRPSSRKPKGNKGHSLGSSSADSAAANRDLFNNMSQGKLMDRLKGAWSGFQRGRDSMDRDAEFAQPYRDSAQRVHSKMGNTHGKANDTTKAYGLKRDMDTTVKNDVKEFGMNKKQVDQAIELLDNYVDSKPQSYGLQPDNNTGNVGAGMGDAKYAEVGEAVRRTLNRMFN